MRIYVFDSVQAAHEEIEKVHRGQIIDALLHFYMNLCLASAPKTIYIYYIDRTQDDDDDEIDDDLVMESLQCLKGAMGSALVKKEEVADDDAENRAPKRVYERPVATPARNTSQTNGDYDKEVQQTPNPSPAKKKLRKLSRQDMPRQNTKIFWVCTFKALLNRVLYIMYILLVR